MKMPTSERNNFAIGRVITGLRADLASVRRTVPLKIFQQQRLFVSGPDDQQGLAMLQRFDNPWMRAMIVAPNAAGFMSTSLYGAQDVTTLRAQMHKPTTAVMMTFSEDPYLGTTSDQFRGNAVVFVATVTFRQRTAALQ